MTETRLWVFGYGSLIWDPGFAVAARRVARLHGFRRAFCMRSVRYRGTPERPGLVLALDAAAGAACDGVAFAVEPGAEETTLAYLRERELVTDAYLERRLPVDLAGGGTVTALTYVIDKAHVQYCGDLALEEQAGIIATAAGGRGANADYLYNTAAHLDDLGLNDSDMTWLAARVRTLRGATGEMID